MTATKTALTFIFITVLVDVIGIGVIIPVIPQLLEELTGAGTDTIVIYGMWLLVSFAGMQFLFSPTLGELSDRYGRKPILLIALLGLSIDYLIHAFAPTLAWLILGRLFAGICGASFTVASAYIADVSTKENKAKNFGLIGAAFGLGFIIGPAIGGIFGEIDIRLPFFIAAGLTFLNFLFGLFLVPESLAKEKRRAIQYDKMIPGVSLVNLKKYKGVVGLIFAFFLANLAGQALPTTWSYYTIERYDWSEMEIGISLMVVGLLVSIVQGFLIGWSVKTFGKKKVIQGGFFFWFLGMFLFSFAAEPWMLYVFLIPYALGGIAGPTVQGLISNEVPEKEQGNLQGALTSMVSLTSIIGFFMFSTVFSYFIKPDTIYYFVGSPYLLGSIILVLAFIVANVSIRNMNFEENPVKS